MGKQSINERYHLLDAVRGICLISMILFHAAYDLVELFGVKITWFHGSIGYLWQQSICWTFILLSGMCWSLGRKHLKRGIIVFACGGLITAVTALFSPEQIVRNGILTFMGSAMLLLIPLEKLVKKLPPAAGLAGSFFLFFISRNINRGELGFEGITLVRLWERAPDQFLLTWLGAPSAEFYSSDYFSILPWFFLYLTGYFLWRLAAGREVILKLLKKKVFLLSLTGRQTLPVYMLHQPVVMAVLTVAAGLLAGNG